MDVGRKTEFIDGDPFVLMSVAQWASVASSCLPVFGPNDHVYQNLSLFRVGQQHAAKRLLMAELTDFLLAPRTHEQDEIFTDMTPLVFFQILLHLMDQILIIQTVIILGCFYYFKNASRASVRYVILHYQV